MKRIILVRHSQAQQDKTEIDFEKQLTKVGQKDSKIIAEAILAHGIKLDAIVTSDAVRAKETAEIFANIFNIEKSAIIEEHFLYDGYTTGQLTDFIYTQPNEYETILIIGHNPFISQAGIRLSRNFHRSFPTTGCLGLKFMIEDWHIEAGSGDIDFFEFPKKYR